MLTATALAAAPAAERGRALYLNGRHADGRPLTATTGSTDDAGTPLPPAFLACVNCHGFDARGKTEGGITTSDLRWATLAGPYDFTRPDGRRRAPYDEARFLAALTTGRDSSGQPLDPTMPRFALSATDAADLVAYLRQIGRPSADEGVTADAIHLGLATSDPLAARAADDLELLNACFARLNRSGGVFRRHIEVIAIPSRAGVTAVASVTAERPAVLALFALDETTADAAARWASEGIPVFRVHGAPVETAARRYLFALFPPAGAAAAVAPGASDFARELLSDYHTLRRARSETVATDELRQMAALAWAKIIVAALEAAGRDLTREELVATLESLRDFRGVLAQPVNFTPSRHTAAVSR